MKLDVKALGLSCAIIWGIGVFALTWWLIAFDGITGEPTPLAPLYRGHTVSPIGSLIGLGYAAVDGLVGGVVLAWLYNVLSARNAHS